MVPILYVGNETDRLYIDYKGKYDTVSQSVSEASLP